MRRRQLSLALGLISLAAPLAGLTQSTGRIRRIGVLSLGNPASEAVQQVRWQFLDALRRAGYEEGKNVVIESRFAEGDEPRLAGLADELVRLDVEVIVASLNHAIAAAKRATRTIPIVMYGAAFPVELGFVQSLARPGGNITGTTWSGPEITGKSFELLKEAAPSATRVAILSNPTIPGAELTGPAAVDAANALGMSFQRFFVTRPEDVPAALDRIAASRPDALFVGVDSIVGSRMREIATFALQHKLVSIGTIPQYVKAGGILYYGLDLAHIMQRTISHVDRILKGAQPVDLPVEQPTKFELVINMKTAKAIGLAIPKSLLLRADEVIQ